MALVQTPDGGMVTVPDGLFAPSSYVQPQQVSATEYGLNANAINRVPVPAPPPPPPPSPVPPKGTQKLGVFGGTGVDEVSQVPDTGPPSVTGGALPGIPTAPAAAPQADYAAGAAMPLTDKTLAQSNKAYGQKQASQAAYNASPDGQLAGADAMQGQADQATQQAIGADLGVKQGVAADTYAATQANVDAQKQLQADQKQFQQDYERTHAQKQAYVDATMRDVDNFKIDPHKEFRGASKVGWLIAVALSGIGDSIQNKSGPNPVLGMMQEAMQQSIRLQMDQRDQLKAKNANAEHALDKFDAFSKDQRAQFELRSAQADKWLAQQIQLTAAKYADPAAKANAMKLSADAMQSSADHAQKAAEFAVNKDMQGKQIALTRRGQDIESYNQSQNRAQQSKFHSDDLALHIQEHSDEMEFKAKQLEQEGQKQAAAAVRAQAAQTQERGAFIPQAVTDKDGKVQLRTAPLQNRDGTPFLATTKEEGIELRKKTGAAYNIIQNLDELRKIREEVGGESSWGNSDAYQRMQVIKNNLVTLRKAGLQGMSSDSDMDKIIAGLGAADPASFRSQMASLDEGRNQVARIYNTELHTQYGYDGEDINFADPLKAPKPPESDAMKKNRAIENYAPGLLDTGTPEGLTKAVSIIHQAELESADPAKRDGAIAQLQLWSQTGATSQVRDMAASALKTAELGIGGNALPLTREEEAARNAPVVTPTVEEPAKPQSALDAVHGYAEKIRKKNEEAKGRVSSK